MKTINLEVKGTGITNYTLLVDKKPIAYIDKDDCSICIKDKSMVFFNDDTFKVLFRALDQFVYDFNDCIDATPTCFAVTEYGVVRIMTDMKDEVLGFKVMVNDAVIINV